ncbi:MAG: hypothetical protein FJZ00_11955 [Candidatus Sericytochromatia bacterium]|uniref:Uncharacterized protein n=1 Tax=Candidatus Tanganyikabacteria bacterium TaxID=2961651 RepID=A0A937X4E9_9BACT|nr:hypothetical protein [Candidatus Tanganyikabacteria bacterium]
MTGLILVYGQPTRFFTNIFFWLKTVMMILAGVNALAFHKSTYRFVARWEANPILPLEARSAGVLSVILWAAVIVAGRLIAYNWWELR